MSIFSKKKEFWVIVVCPAGGTPAAKAFSHPFDARDALTEWVESSGIADTNGRTPEECGRDSSFTGCDGSWGYVFDLDA